MNKSKNDNGADEPKKRSTTTKMIYLQGAIKKVMS